MFPNRLKILLVQFSDLLKRRFWICSIRFTTDKDSPQKDTDNDKVFTPIEEAFNKAYRRFRINSDLKVDVETFLNKIRSKLIDLISNQLDEMNLAKIQFILWLKFRKQEGDEEIQIDKAFNSKITEFFQASDFNELIEEMFSHIKTQIENPALPASGFSLDQVLHLHIDFHKLNLTRGSSYIPLPRLDFQKESGDQSKE